MVSIEITLRKSEGRDKVESVVSFSVAVSNNL